MGDLNKDLYVISTFFNFKKFSRLSWILKKEFTTNLEW